MKFDNAANVDGSKKLTGEITCKIVGKMPDQPAVRISYFKGEVKVKFSVPPINSKDDQKKTYGPLPVFVDVCTIKENGGNIDVNVISNTVGELVTVSRPE